MDPLPVEIPLHAYQGAGPWCDYAVGGRRCNDNKDASVHWVADLLAPTKQTEHTPQQPGERTFYDTYTGRITMENPPTITQEFLVWFNECVLLMDNKSVAYGNAWRAQGYMGNLARVMSKTERLRNMLWNDDNGFVGTEAETESVGDTLRDLCNLATFMWLNYRDGNRWGQ